MGFVRIEIKNEYKKPGDIVHRGFLRVLKGLKDDVLTSSNGVYLYGIKDGETIRELFTGNIINTPYCEEIKDDDSGLVRARQIAGSDSQQCKRLREAIKYAYGEENSLGIEWPMEVIANDRAVEHDGYINGMTLITPYSHSDIDGWDKLKHKFTFATQLLNRMNNRTEKKRKV